MKSLIYFADTPVTHCSSNIVADTPETESRDTAEEQVEKNGGTDFTGIELLLEASKWDVVKKERRMKFLKTLPIEQVYDLAAQKLEDVDVGWREFKNNSTNNLPGPRINPFVKVLKEDASLMFCIQREIFIWFQFSETEGRSCTATYCCAQYTAVLPECSKSN